MAKVGGVEAALVGPSAVAVALVHWPTEAAVRARLAADGLPRLLLVAPDAQAPDDFDDLEDWIRLPADERDVSVRVKALSERARRVVSPPVLLDGWLLRFGGREAALSESEAAVVGHLLARWGELVSRDDLTARLGAGRGGRAAGLDDVVYRVRRRLRPLGLEIHAARARGLMLHLAAHTGDQDQDR